MLTGLVEPSILAFATIVLEASCLACQTKELTEQSKNYCLDCESAVV